MNDVISNFSLALDKYTPGIHLWELEFTYSTCGAFNKNEEKTKKNKETGDSRYIYQTELDEACFQHNMAHGGSKHLPRSRTSDKLVRDKGFN